MIALCREENRIPYMIILAGCIFKRQVIRIIILGMTNISSSSRGHPGKFSKGSYNSKFFMDEILDYNTMNKQNKHLKVKTVGILSPGDMGGKVGSVLKTHGLEVLTCLSGRSERTRELASDAGFSDVPSLRELVERCDLIMSILVPSEAMGVAEKVAEAISATGKRLPFADCNAVSPDTSSSIGKVVENAGGLFIDAGIIGAPPSSGNAPRIYASGEHAAILAQLDGKGILVPVIEGDEGRAKASALKMCYASLTKGTAALYVSALVVAARLGLYDDLIKELGFSQGGMLEKMQSVNSLSAKAFRWVGEMEEIADTFDSAGVTPFLHRGAAAAFQMVADSEIGHERPETVDRSRSLEETTRILSRVAR